VSPSREFGFSCDSEYVSRDIPLSGWKIGQPWHQAGVAISDVMIGGPKKRGGQSAVTSVASGPVRMASCAGCEDSLRWNSEAGWLP
jgi:hypothetical protein